MRFHLLAPPNCQTTAAYDIDGFVVRTMLFARLLKRLGHHVTLYGAGANEAPCDEFVPCMSAEEHKALIGDIPYQCVPFDPTSPLYLTFNVRAATHIRTRKQPGDIIATIVGSASGLVFEHHPELLALEYSIGYRGIGAPFRVYESHAWRHCVHGFTGVDSGRPFDTVIYPWWPEDQHPVCDEPDDYVAYAGRIVPTKGIAQVCEAAKAAGVKLLVMGYGDPSLITYGEFLGAVSAADRDRILSKAQAVLMPTQYIEPFGNVAAEAQLCGTPVITTDFGAFVESVEQGATGFRCATVGEMIQAIEAVGSLDRRYVRQRAVRLFGEQAAMAQYAAFFRRLAVARGDGINSRAPLLDLPDWDYWVKRRQQQPAWKDEQTA